jgi:predicted PhzF superfamily epimerase YddE/YHI9
MTDLWLIDAFADAPFSGNPAAVCMLPGHRPDSWHQALAAEMNQAETAFLTTKDGDWGLRWFTPRAEVDLCGHATLASAHFLWESGRLPRTMVARFHTRSGLLSAESDGAWIVLDFPRTPASEAAAPDGLLEALGCKAKWIGRSRFDVLVELESAEMVRALEPDLARLAETEARGVIVTAPGDVHGVDFVSRFFAPRVGVPEDPVTGSAHCALAPYWAERLGRLTLTGHQVSPRGGMVRVEIKGDRVLLGGKARTVMRGELKE